MAKAGATSRAQKSTAGEQVVTIPVVDPKHSSKVEEVLAAQIPEWEQLTSQEQDEFKRLTIASGGKTEPVRVKLRRREDGGFGIEPVGRSSELACLKLLNTFAVGSNESLNARSNDLLRYLESVGAGREGSYNAALAFVESMAPENQAEALLLVQMYCTHDAAIRALSQFGSADMIPQAQMFGNLATKLLRTSQAQMETLARLRRGGEQVIKHVHIDNRGGQAIVTESVQAGGQNGKVSEQPRGADAGGSSLLGQDTARNGVPIPCDEREAAMQDSWRAVAGRA